jgi:hypothetical protein
MDQRSYHRHLNRIAVKISAAVDGEALFDVASAAAVVSAFSIREAFAEPERRHNALTVIADLMQKIITDE